MIKPTIGRIVWYHPEHDARPIAYSEQPLAAIVTYVWSDRMVNLAVFDSNGNPHSRTSVTLVQDGDETPNSIYCEWMPYQKAVAEKALPAT